MAKSTLKFKDSVAAFEALRAEIAARRFAPIYLLMGEESYFIDALCEQLSSSILTPAEQSFNQITVYGKDSDAGQVVNLCRQMPMMGSHEVIILKEAQQLRQIEKLTHYTSKPQPSTILIICHKEKTLDKRSALYKQCQKEGVVFESVRPRDYEIGPWLTQFIQRKGLGIAPKAVQMLTDHLGCDVAKLSSEIDKLMLALPVGTKSITDQHIEQNVGISKEFNNFELCNAVAVWDVERAMRIADHFARNPKDNPLLVTVMALYSLFRDMFIINYLRWLSKHKGQPMPSEGELMRILKKSNPYAVRELSQQSTRWPNRKVFTVLGLLREYDGKSKGIDTGGMNDGELLRELLLKIFMQ
ncbi:MAG: DNA polymerase III subunit delta [Alistipes sp.]|nr:DNA polymerase III subunit delta [Rikenellaceae bacterium]MBO4993664.1 DNA polymerase III subunit delta [Alistipes sp.]MBO5399833.1 DNA polymerase III subunit delta [Alistipes sp.]